ncbi:cytochrome oxidase assembly protein [Streptomyces tsukubensis]|nr:cytochrome oxidase assembly protein [Streptomyces tsukubensis]
MASIGIIVTGGVVRVTGSGLGCPEWPTCEGENLAPTAEMGVHGAIEFGNRLLTGAICVVVGWLIVTARLQRTPARSVLRGAWAQFWVVVLNAVVGGVAVWMRLSPWVVAAHFLAAMLLLTTAVFTWDRTRPPAGPTPPLPPRETATATGLLWVTGAVAVLGTLVTGSGPHAGDSSDVHRMPFDWTVVTVVHGVLAAVALSLIGLLLHRLDRSHPGPARRRTAALLLVVLAQSLIGLFQSLTDLPGLAVVLHMLGAALVWSGALRVFLATRDSAPTGPYEVGAPPPRALARS